MLPDLIIWVCISCNRHDQKLLFLFVDTTSHDCWGHAHVRPSCIHFPLQKKGYNSISAPFLKNDSESASSWMCFHVSFTLHNWQVCVYLSSLFADGVGEHWGDAGHVLGDSGHLPVSSYGHGGRAGVCQLSQLQWDWSGEEHVIRRADEAVPPPGSVLLWCFQPFKYIFAVGFISLTATWACWVQQPNFFFFYRTWEIVFFVIKCKNIQILLL